MSIRSFAGWPRRGPLAAALAAVACTAPATARAQAPAGAPRPVTLAEALALAEERAPALVQARGSVRSAEASVRQAWSQYIPSLSLNLSNAQQSPVTPRINPTTGELVTGRWALSEGFGANITIFDGLRRLNTVRSAQANAEAALSSESAQRWQVALQVKQQFYASLAAREAEAAAQAQLKQAEQQLVISLARVKAGTATRSDSLRAKIQVGQAQLAVVTARNDRQVADASLARLVGATAMITANPDGVPDELSVALDSAALADLALRGPAVRQADAALLAANATSRGARGAYLPSIAASWNRNRVATTNEFDLTPDAYNYSGQLRLTLSLPIFNQWQREQQVVTADVARTTAEAQARDARLLAQQTLVQALAALRTAQEQIAVQAASVVAGEEDLRVQQERYELGASTLLDVLTSQATLNQARVSLVQARFSARLAKAQLEALVGREL